MTSKTPITDKAAFPVIDADTDECTHAVPVRVAEKLETELAEAQKHLSAIMAVLPDDAKPCDAPHLILHFKKQMGAYGGEFIRVEKQLAEARAEIERKDQLIEQMREALCMADGLIDTLILDNTLSPSINAERMNIRAAIEAAERKNDDNQKL